jgi:SAM-dependent methyltransferase
MEKTVNRDRRHWNDRYSHDPWAKDPSRWLVDNSRLLPPPGTAIDIAGGTGRNALWLAQRGWKVTLVDVSDVALNLATDRARKVDVSLVTGLIDLSTDPLPAGPWNLVLLFHYLDRDLFSQIESALEPGGMLIGSLATVTNLERNDRPPRQYLLGNGELPSLLSEFEMLDYNEVWNDDRHDARFVAQRTAFK